MSPYGSVTMVPLFLGAMLLVVSSSQNCWFAAREQFEDPAVLMKNMQANGLTLSQTALGPMGDPNDPNQVHVVLIMTCLFEGN
jgi:hypothetical protein